MATQVTWSHKARTHLARIHRHIAEDSSVYANRFTKKLIQHTQDQLSNHPLSGRKVPEFHQTPLGELREIIFKGYRIIYNPAQAPEQVTVLAVMSGRMDLENNF